MTANNTTGVSIPMGDAREQSVRLSTGCNNRIILVGPLRGTIWARLMDYEEIEPLAERAYSIELTREELTGTTDDEGVLRHDDVVLGYYTLDTGEDQTTVFSEIEPDEPAIVRMPFTESSDEAYMAATTDVAHLQVNVSDDDEIEIPGEADHG